MGNKTSAVAAIAAANGLPPPSATVITLNNSVLEAGVYNRVLNSGDGPMVLLLPPAPTDGMVVGFTVVGFVGAQNTRFVGNGKDIAGKDGVGSQVYQSFSTPVLFRFDEDQDLWTVLVGDVGGEG
jgi:hypothetical protein